MKLENFGIVIVWAMALSAPVVAQEPRSAGRRGAAEWFLGGGYGFSTNLGPSNPHVQFVAFTPQYSRFLGERTEYVIEGHLGRFVGPNGHLVGVLPLGLRLHARGGLSSYVSASSGFGWTDLTELAEIDQRFNFLLQGGAGMHWAHGRQDWLFEVRWLHVSNANASGRNLGVNSLALVAGRRFDRRQRASGHH